ncbi:Unknown protein, partial [Striga hermonthica]
CEWLNWGGWLGTITDGLPPDASVHLLGDRNCTSVGLCPVSHNVLTNCWVKPVDEPLCSLGL